MDRLVHLLHRLVEGPGLFAAIVAIMVLHAVWFLILPSLLTRRETHNPRLRRWLQWVVATPSLLGDSIRNGARHDLMRLANREGLHELAATQGFAILRHHGISPSLAAEVGGRLADALDGLGRHEEAEDYRAGAVQALKASDRDSAWYINRGRQLSADQDFAGACLVLEEGLAVTDELFPEARYLLSLGLSIALFRSGRLRESADRAVEAIALADSPERRLLAVRQAGAALSDLGRDDEAEVLKAHALEIAEGLGDPREIADCRANLAAMARKRGDLVGALAACDRAGAGTNRANELTRSEILRSLGRFEESVAAMEHAARLDPNSMHRAEVTMQGIFSYGRANILMHAGALAGVADLLDSAWEALADDPKLSLWVEAAFARLAALEGRSDDAIEAADELSARLERSAMDTNTRLSVLGSLGRAAVHLEDYARALDYWTRYSEAGVSPVDWPTALYYLGECRLGLGDLPAARACFTDAVALGLPTHDSARARSRLREIAV